MWIYVNMGAKSHGMWIVESALRPEDKGGWMIMGSSAILVRVSHGLGYSRNIS